MTIVDGSPATCTCPWWAKYRGGRGPCKHALAVGMVLTGDREEVHA
ncbi:SWIM zinc finger family protein [Luedemannella flava]